MADTIPCPHCGTHMAVEYDRFYGGVPRYRAQCPYCGMAGPLCAAEEAAISAVSDLGRNAQAEIARQQAEIGRLTAKYDELIYAVASKFPNESRHETALRYILQREEHVCGRAAALISPTPPITGPRSGSDASPCWAASTINTKEQNDLHPTPWQLPGHYADA